jgi:hypothetical protein
MYTEIKKELERFLNSKQSFGKAEIMAKIAPIISALTNSPAPKCFVVPEIKKYDVLYLNVIGIMHYVLVHKVTDTEVRGVVLSSKKDAHNLLYLENDRFFARAYATKTYVTYELDQCKGAFSRVYECRKEANEVFARLNKFHKDSFKRSRR